jgi:hypothetical protein
LGLTLSIAFDTFAADETRDSAVEVETANLQLIKEEAQTK